MIKLRQKKLEVRLDTFQQIQAAKYN